MYRFDEVCHPGLRSRIWMRHGRQAFTKFDEARRQKAPTPGAIATRPFFGLPVLISQMEVTYTIRINRFS